MDGLEDGSAQMDGYQTNAGLNCAEGQAKQKKDAVSGVLSQRRKRYEDHLRCGLVLRGHPVANRHSGILATCLLLLLEVLIVGHLLLLLIGHVARVHARARHTALGRVVSHILGSLRWDIRGLNAILGGSRVGGIQAGLESRN